MKRRRTPQLSSGALVPGALAAIVLLAGLGGCAHTEALRLRVQSQEMELNRLRQENAEFRDAYYRTKEALESQLAQAQKTLEDTQRQLEEARTLRSERERQLEDQLRTRTLELQALRNEADDQRRLAETQIAQLQQTLQSTVAERDATLKKLAELETQLRDEQNRTAELTRQLGEQKIEVQQLTNRVATLQREVEEGAAQLDAERRNRSAAEQKAADTEKQLAEARAQLEDARRRASDAERERDRLRQQAQAVSQSNAELEKLRQEKAALEAQLARAQAASADKDPALQQALTTITATLAKVPQRTGAQAALQSDGLHIILPSDALFERGAVILSEAGKALVAALAPVLADLARRHNVRIEGHTDNQPIGDLPFADNWGLGFARADRVRAALMDAGVPGDRLTALTRGPFQPRAPNNTPQGREANRRVEIVIGPAAD